MMALDQFLISSVKIMLKLAMLLSSIRNNIVEQDLVSDKVFSFWLNGDPKVKKGGELIFGGVDPKHFKGEHTYVPITRKGYWQIEMAGFLVGGLSTGVCEGGYAAIMDSGISLLAGPTPVVAEINHAIGVEGVLSVECKEVVSQYREMICDLLVSGVQPVDVCSQVGLCSAKKDQSNRNDPKSIRARNSSPR